ncbi:hypothetical protein PR202_gb16402 [Eleusine coracana subsp. coracana]|uniref:Uncharacterized protein n=1 Tax=Eleusine coracana subsp. coracana TaxID=191504 RepID=A0AAV5F092_ELECO|nr:hypothetical protein PR202_gb16402 [Eleusine coracana subsp. coracana]
MGISKVTGIAATALLFTSVSLWEIGLRIATVPVLATCLVAWIVTFAFHTAINLPWILGKNSVGRFPIWSVILFDPFLMLARSYAIVKRFMRKEFVYDQIAEGLYLGGWPFLLKHLPPGGPSVIDCTCELPRSSFVPKDEYLCLATWDTRAPATHQIELATRHGRSAYIMCAILVAMGIAEN